MGNEGTGALNLIRIGIITELTNNKLQRRKGTAHLQMSRGTRIPKNTSPDVKQRLIIPS